MIQKKQTEPETIWISSKQAAQLLGIHPVTLCRWRSEEVEGQPKYHKVGKKVRYRRSVIEAWIESNAVEN
jgi:excisionase family DNA binding protein